MKFYFTKHTKGKFKTLKQLGWLLTRKTIKETIVKPDALGIGIERNAKFALKKLDDKHDLRVIYSDSGGIIVIITFYPTRRNRYG